MKGTIIERADLAQKLGMTAEELLETYQNNGPLGFPPPLDADATHWSADAVLNWVVECQSKFLNLTQHIAVELQNEK
jgi:hypothetical protein